MIHTMMRWVFRSDAMRTGCWDEALNYNSSTLAIGPSPKVISGETSDRPDVPECLRHAFRLHSQPYSALSRARRQGFSFTCQNLSLQAPRGMKSPSGRAGGFRLVWSDVWEDDQRYAK